MNNIEFLDTLSAAREISPASTDPYSLCRLLGIEVIESKPTHKEGYLVCEEGYKLIFVSSNVKNRHRRKFIVSHEIGHFMLHRNQLYCCSNISEGGTSRVNSSAQEHEANLFASEYLLPQSELLKLLPIAPVQFSDISNIAQHFDISMTFSAIKAVELSNTENEVLLCYEGQKLKWFASGDKSLQLNKLPSAAPMDFSTTRNKSDIAGAWETLYEGSVHQEIFSPIGNQYLVLLSGTRINEEEDFYEF